MEHFRILPTDQRIKELSEEQIEILYLSFLHLPEDDSVRYSYHKADSRKEKAEELRKIMREQGKPERIIDIMVKEFLEND
jgi:hypothetical protein